jgi:transcriptional/translational regulatory protein YebC/TACO1
MVSVKCAKRVASKKYGETDTDEPVDTDVAMLEIMDIDGVIDIQVSDDPDQPQGSLDIMTEVKDITGVRSALEAFSYVVLSAGVVKVPDQPQHLSDEAMEKLAVLLDALDEHEDVEDVWTTAA